MLRPGSNQVPAFRKPLSSSRRPTGSAAWLSGRLLHGGTNAKAGTWFEPGPRSSRVIGAERFEGRPAGVPHDLVVRVRLHVQILAALRAEARAVGSAEDLVRQRERNRVARPGREVDGLVADDIR